MIRFTIQKWTSTTPFADIVQPPDPALAAGGGRRRQSAGSGRSYRQRASAYSLDKAMKMDAPIRSLDQAVAILRE
jgi:hypothetical protein